MSFSNRELRALIHRMIMMAVAAWGTVLTDTWVVYPWYRAKIPTSPKSILLSNESTAQWHVFSIFMNITSTKWVAP